MVKSEGYGRRRYKNEFIKFLVYAQASCDESEVHLNFMHDSGYINEQEYDTLKDEAITVRAGYSHLISHKGTLYDSSNNFIFETSTGKI